MSKKNMIEWNAFVSDNIHLLRELPSKEKMRILGEMFQEMRMSNEEPIRIKKLKLKKENSIRVVKRKTTIEIAKC